jgi:hypothetical protein
LLLGAAGAFALLAVTARGPLGLARICGPRLHAALDIVVPVALAAAPILPALRPNITGILVVEVTAVAWVRLATLTRYRRVPLPGVAAAGVAVAGADGTSATTVTPPAQDTPGGATLPPTQGAVIVRGLGFLAGRSARRLPEAQEKLDSGARQAGRHAARLQRTWRKPPA